MIVGKFYLNLVVYKIGDHEYIQCFDFGSFGTEGIANVKQNDKTEDSLASDDVNFLNNAVPNDEKQNDITEDTLASDDVIFIHNAIADERKQNDITEDTLASDDVIFLHNAIADERKQNI